MNNLKKVRETSGMTQLSLSINSGVNLRLIQAYEQGYKDINKAQVVTVLSLADTLGCDIRDILNEQ